MSRGQIGADAGLEGGHADTRRTLLPAGYDLSCSTVLETAPGMSQIAPKHSCNLTPWVTRFFFMHTYYVYTYVFYMFVLAFYKGYALEYPASTRWMEMALIMTFPLVHHLRFYFGYWGCEFGFVIDLCVFLTLCTLVMCQLMYFIFWQAYVMPTDLTVLFVGALAVCIEGLCGIVNALQALTLRQLSVMQRVMLSGCVMMSLASILCFAVVQMLPQQAVTEEWVQSPRLPHAAHK
jgi:hypothetical protein